MLTGMLSALGLLVFILQTWLVNKELKFGNLIDLDVFILTIRRVSFDCQDLYHCINVAWVKHTSGYGNDCLECVVLNSAAKCTHTDMYTNMHIYTHAHTNTYTHAHTYNGRFFWRLVSSFNLAVIGSKLSPLW